MSDLLSIGGYAPPATGRLSRPDLPTANPQQPLESAGASRFDAELQRILAQTSFRVARARAIRAEIESGGYETPERIRGAVARLLDVIG